MKVRDLLRLVVSNLGRMKGRVIMTATGVVIGTAAIMVLISLASGLQRRAQGDLLTIGSLTEIEVSPPYEMAPGTATARRRRAVLNDRALAEFRKLPGVVAVTPVEPLRAYGTLRYGRLTAGAQVEGIDPAQVDRLGFSVASGVARLGGGHVIVGAEVAGGFYDPRGRPVSPAPDLEGQMLLLLLTRTTEDGNMVERTVRLRVVGVLEKGGARHDYAILMSLPEVLELNTWHAGRRVNPARDGYQRVLVKVAQPDQTAAVERKIQRQGFYTFSAHSFLRQINTFFLIVQGILGGIGAITLVVAAFGIANTMLMSIYERTKEIGLMKAIGARNQDVMSVFLAESGGIGLLGGMGGALLGILLSGIINIVASAYLGAQAAQTGAAIAGTMSIAYTPLWLPVFAVLFATGVGVLSGIYPATRAASMDPISALRYE